MELEQPSPRNNHSSKVRSIEEGPSSIRNEKVLKYGLESFRMLEKGLPLGSSDDKKLQWLRSQVIGSDQEVNTPFGKRLLTYADYTASGRSLLYIENYIMQYVLPFYGNTHTSDSYVGEQTTKMVHEATQYVKKCLGGKEDDALLFVGSGTTAAIKRLQEVMALSVPSTLRKRVLMSLKEEERWVVFVGPYEHHSNLLSWRQSLAEVVEIGLDAQGSFDMVALRLKLEHYITTNRPMLGSFSACSNVTGLYTDTRALAHLLHHYSAFACFDFAASGPYVEVGMRSGEIDGYDAVFLSPHKFLGGPSSPGILLMNKSLYQLSDSPPSTCGGGTVNFVNGLSETHTIYHDHIEEREDAGTPPIIQKIRAAMAFWVKEFIGHHVIEEKEHTYIKLALHRLNQNPNVWILGNTTLKRQAILSFFIHSTTNSYSVNESNTDGRLQRVVPLWGENGNFKDKFLHGPFVAKLLNDLFGIQARGGCACAGPYGHLLLNADEKQSLAMRSNIEMGYAGTKPGWTRINFSYHIPTEEFEFIMAAIEFITVYGQRFLVLYNFSWETGSWTFKNEAFKENLVWEKHRNDHSISSISHSTNNIGLEDKVASSSTKATISNKYISYLETAKKIAYSLPKFPQPRKVPEKINLDAVYFKV